MTLALSLNQILVVVLIAALIFEQPSLCYSERSLSILHHDRFSPQSSDFRQLSRRRLVLDLCYNHESVEASQPPPFASRPANSIECNKYERLVLKSFASGHGGGHEHKSPDVCSGRISLSEICASMHRSTDQSRPRSRNEQRLTSSLVPVSDGYNQTSISGSPIVRLESCEELLQAKKKVFSALANRCDGQIACTNLSVSSPLIDCSVGVRQNLDTWMVIDYLCLPNEENFGVRTITYQDISNSVGCLSHELLYIRRVSIYLTLKVNSTGCGEACVSPMSAGSDEDLSKFSGDQPDFGRSSLNFSSSGAPASEIGLDISFGGAKRSNHPQIDRRFKKNSCIADLKMLTEDIARRCNAKPECSISLRRMANERSRMSSCLSQGPDMNGARIEIDHRCLSRERFSSTYHAQMRTSDITDDEGVIVGFETLDEDYTGNKPAYISVCGPITVEQLGLEMNSRTLDSSAGHLQHSVIGWAIPGALFGGWALISLNWPYLQV